MQKKIIIHCDARCIEYDASKKSFLSMEVPLNIRASRY